MSYLFDFYFLHFSTFLFKLVKKFIFFTTLSILFSHLILLLKLPEILQKAFLKSPFTDRRSLNSLKTSITFLNVLISQRSTTSSVTLSFHSPQLPPTFPCHFLIFCDLCAKTLSTLC